MKWRWSIVGLAAAGIVAGLCAAVLVILVKSPGKAKTEPNPETTYVCAAKALPAMARLTSDAVVTRTIAVKQAPEGSFANPAQVVGKVLAIPLVEGQAVTQSCFVPNGAAPQMAANIPSGKRAVTLSLPEDSSMKGLLYPGSLVDVVASFDVPSERAPGGRALVSRVLVSGVEVLAVEDKTVFTSETPASTGGLFGGGAGATVQRKERPVELVTLLTDPAQAQSLRLAMQHGAVSLAMRNPTDQTVPDAKVTMISDLLGPGWAEALRSEAAAPAARPAAAPAAPTAMSESWSRTEASMEKAPKSAEKPHWDVRILRGGVSEIQSFDLPPASASPARK